MKAYTLIELLVVLFIAATFAAILAVIIVGCQAVRKVANEGLKPTLEEVWEGPK